jgi:hypothetical protein
MESDSDAAFEAGDAQARTKIVSLGTTFGEIGKAHAVGFYSRRIRTRPIRPRTVGDIIVKDR